MPSAVSRGRLEEHKISGSTQQNLPYTRLLVVFIITNAIAALCQLCEAVVIYSITLANSKADTILRQGILLVC
jgi:Na+/H+ antiporter NhaB